MSLTITSTVKDYPKRLPYIDVADKILGKKYEVSLTFVGPTRAQTLNKTYRQKTYTPNVLSFPLTEEVGEVYICPEVANKEAKKFELTPNGYITFLFIHSCLHLKGLDHGPEMEKLEAKFKKQFKVK